MSTETKITDALEAIQLEGVEMAELGAIEAKLLTLLYRARRLRNAESMLPLIGADAAAERLNCCRATIYNLAKKARRKSKNSAVA